MTVDEVRARVARITAAQHDPEMAHSLEDDLYADLLKAIAQGECSMPAACAAEALETKLADFERWCA